MLLHVTSVLDVVTLQLVSPLVSSAFICWSPFRLYSMICYSAIALSRRHVVASLILGLDFCNPLLGRSLDECKNSGVFDVLWLFISRARSQNREKQLVASPYVSLSAWNNLSPTVRISMKLYI
jgi:hypothetical protein